MILIRGPQVRRYTWFGYEGDVEVHKAKLAERQRLCDADAESADAANGSGSTNVEKTRPVHKESQEDDEATEDIREIGSAVDATPVGQWSFLARNVGIADLFL